MRIRWAPSAAADLHHINDYLQDHHPRYRQRTIGKLYDEIRSLKTHPYRGKVGREEGTRELVLSPLPYVAVYRINEQTIEILRIYHGAQNRRVIP